MSDIDVLYEDNHLLALNKPAGLATMGTPGDTASLLDLAREYIKRRYQKPGNVYLGVVSRLDAPVTGVVVIARTSKAAARLTEQFRSGTVEKLYWAVVEGSVPAGPVACEGWIVEDERHRRMHLVPADTPDAKLCRLTYRRLEALGDNTLVEVAPATGRKHQIRVQLAARGNAIVGDRKYGSRRAFSPGIALHARRLVIDHPVLHQPVELTAPVPGSWKPLGGLNQRDWGLGIRD